MLIDSLLLLLSLIGFLISLYFTLVYYRKIPANYFLVPQVCRMEEGACQAVLSTRDARVFGVPNFVLGLGYYSLILFIVLIKGFGVDPILFKVFLWVSILVVLFSVYLSYSLLFKIKTACPLCFISHGINTLIALLFLFKTI